MRHGRLLETRWPSSPERWAEVRKEAAQVSDWEGVAGKGSKPAVGIIFYRFSNQCDHLLQCQAHAAFFYSTGRFPQQLILAV